MKFLIILIAVIISSLIVYALLRLFTIQVNFPDTYQEEEEEKLNNYK